MNTFAVCFVGLGSIARRHIKNLVEIFRKQGRPLQIDCCRSSRRELPEDVAGLIHTVYYSSKEVPEGYDAVFITNPTSLHLDALREFEAKSRHFFVEKPLCDPGEDVMGVLRTMTGSPNTYYVACPLRYTNVIQYLKKNVDFSKAYSVRCISSSYLPDWRPGTDYRETYSAHKVLGGGVSIDLIHEWDYLYYLIGKPKAVHSMIRRVSNLEIDSDDLAVYLADYGDKLVELHLDYFGRKTIRRIEIFTASETIVGDLVESKVNYLRSGDEVDLSQERNDFQKKELEYFLKLVAGEESNTNDLQKSIDVLKLTRGEI